MILTIKVPDELVMRAVSSLTPEQRRAMDGVVITTCLEAMRDCPDRAVRAEAYDVLMKALRARGVERTAQPVYPWR